MVKRYCIISEILSNTEIAAKSNASLPVAHLPKEFTTKVTFHINSTKLYVPVANSPITDNIKEGFDLTSSWTKQRSETIAQPKNNSLDYMIDPTFKNINRLFVFSFKALHSISRNQRF